MLYVEKRKNIGTRGVACSVFSLYSLNYTIFLIWIYNGSGGKLNVIIQVYCLNNCIELAFYGENRKVSNIKIKLTDPDDPSNTVKKIIIFVGLLFAEISNIIFWIEDAIPIEEFFIFDMFLIFSLLFIIMRELTTFSSDAVLTDYVCLLGALNNFMATLFFLLWGLLFPEKDLAFVKKIGIDGNIQIVFDLISLGVLRYLYLKYRDKITGINKEKVILSEVALFFCLSSTLFII